MIAATRDQKWPEAPAPPPEVGNAGNPGLSTRAPDISNMSPEERFLRLWDRVERAASNGDTTTVRQFAPMALGAYAQLPSADNDQRFHAALEPAVGQDSRACIPKRSLREP